MPYNWYVQTSVQFKYVQEVITIYPVHSYGAPKFLTSASNLWFAWLLTFLTIRPHEHHDLSNWKCNISSVKIQYIYCLYLKGNDDESSGQSLDFRAVSRLNPRYWSSHRLQTWLKENGLERVCLPPELCQGNQLLQMHGHYRKDADKFNNALKSDFKLDDNTVRKFTTAVCKLFEWNAFYTL